MSQRPTKFAKRYGQTKQLLVRTIESMQQLIDGPINNFPGLQYSVNTLHFLLYNLFENERAFHIARLNFSPMSIIQVNQYVASIRELMLQTINSLPRLQNAIKTVQNRIDYYDIITDTARLSGLGQDDHMGKLMNLVNEFIQLHEQIFT